MPKKADINKYDKIVNNPEEKTDEELDFLRKVDEKNSNLQRPPTFKNYNSCIIKAVWKINIQ